MSKELAELLYPTVKQTVKDILETKWDNKGKPALRIAPSPTGFLHVGTIGTALCDYMFARANGGKCYIRIEDTDQKREVENAAQLTLQTFENYGISFDNPEIFYQSKRLHIYHVFAKDLVARGRAYPCFCTESDLSTMRETQEKQKLTTGYYGQFAKCHGMPLEQISARLEKGDPWVLRAVLYTDKERITWHDLIRGDMALPPVQNHPVIVKSNGIPPYNLACMVDDILMGTTHVVRGEEWIASAAEHLQLYEAMGFPHPHYAHIPVICVEENGNKRKLSKRKDREAIAQNFLDEGYPADAVLEYLLTINNSDFELWRIANPTTPWRDFRFRFEKMGSNSPLFDWDKLNHISQNVIANMTCEQINKAVEEYFIKYPNRGAGGHPLQKSDLEKIFTVLAIDRGTERPRKDIAKYSEILTEFDYLFKLVKMTPLLKKYAELIKDVKNKDEWFALVKERATDFGFKNVREFTQAIRMELTGREKSTDLYTLSKIML